MAAIDCSYEAKLVTVLTMVALKVKLLKNQVTSRMSRIRRMM